MTQLAHVTRSCDGYHLHIVAVPLWAYMAERAGDWVCDRTGNMLCAAGLPEWAWKVGAGRRDDEGWPRWSLGSALFAFGQRLHTLAARREHPVYSLPLTTDEVTAYFPEQRMPFLEEDPH